VGGRQRCMAPRLPGSFTTKYTKGTKRIEGSRLILQTCLSFGSQRVFALVLEPPTIRSLFVCFVCFVVSLASCGLVAGVRRHAATLHRHWDAAGNTRTLCSGTRSAAMYGKIYRMIQQCRQIPRTRSTRSLAELAILPRLRRVIRGNSGKIYRPTAAHRPRVLSRQPPMHLA
jgi:hypothetical protein